MAGSWVSGCREALEGGSQRSQNSWFHTASGHPWGIYKELRRDPEEKEGSLDKVLLKESMYAAVGKFQWKLKLVSTWGLDSIKSQTYFCLSPNSGFSQNLGMGSTQN